MDVRHNNNALQELNDCIRGLLHLGLNVITFRTLLHLGPNVITFRTLLHLGQLLHLGLQQGPPPPCKQALRTENMKIICTNLNSSDRNDHLQISRAEYIVSIS